jgi:hypothetical protein
MGRLADSDGVAGDLDNDCLSYTWSGLNSYGGVTIVLTRFLSGCGRWSRSSYSNCGSSHNDLSQMSLRCADYIPPRSGTCKAFNRVLLSTSFPNTNYQNTIIYHWECYNNFGVNYCKVLPLSIFCANVIALTRSFVGFHGDIFLFANSWILE